jgi:lipopolysaccharide biosynthesis glycosyltransferase
MSHFRRSGRRWARRAVARVTGEKVATAAGAARAGAGKARSKRVRRLRGAVIELSAAVTGSKVSQVPSVSRVAVLARRARLQRERARFVTELASGRSLGEALLATTRGLLANGRPSEVAALALRLEMSGVSDEEVPVALALAADHQDHPRLVRAELHRAEPATMATEAAVAGVRAGLLTEDDALVDGVLDHLPRVATDDLVTVACMLRSAGRTSQGRRAVAELAERRDQGSVSDEAARVLQWLDPPDERHEPARRPTVGVLSSFGPMHRPRPAKGQEPSCLGTIAALALVRHAGTGTDRRAVQLVPRDHSDWPRLSGPLWTLAAGRFPASPFGIRPEFPLGPSLEPLFLGFSVVGAPVLDDAAVDYLRSAEPIGCSDVTSVLILLKAGVKAFYSGRIESTLGETLGTVGRLRTDDLEGADAAHLDSLRGATDALTRLAEGSGRIRTSSVGTLVAARALGRPAGLRVDRRGDARLDGPVHHRDGLAPEPELARRMVESVDLVMGAVAAGRPRAAVREAWATFWDPDVRAAQQLWQETPRDLPTSDAPLEAAARIRSAGRRYGPSVTDPDAIHVSLATDQNLLEQLPVTIEAIVRNTSRPLRICLLTRGVGTDTEQALAAAHPSIELSFFPCDSVDHGGRLIKHITASTMDRLLLPEILDGVDRTVYIDIDALVLDDVGQLFDRDLAGAPVAARPSERSMQSIVVHVSAPLDPEPARELRDLVLHRAGHAVPGINAGVLVLDLERMRKDDFCRTFVPWVSRYHLNDQEVVEFYAGDELDVLPERWNAWPYKEVVDDPAVLHWVGPFKPWRGTVTRDQHRWAHYATLADERRRAAPVTGPPSAADA